ncbi:MAG: hypothetical protein VX737_02405 [Pseudomonadota bacterium]|nr:hypothetical protein [Pseudomonadota bacterium]
MIIVLLLLWVSLQADSRVPEFCVHKSCEDANLLSWQQIAQQLDLSPVQGQKCYPQKKNRNFSADDELWTMRADTWHLRSKIGQASQLTGDLMFESTDQLLSSDQAWLWRSEDGGLDRLCLPDGGRWIHSTWEMSLSHVAYQSDADEVTACNNAFVLYGKDDQPLYGYAKEAFSSGKDTLMLKSVHATACPLDDVAWSVSSDRLDWSVSGKKAAFSNVRFYFYDFPIFYVPHWTVVIGKEQYSGWMSPRYMSYHDDPLVVIFPYRLLSQDKKELSVLTGVSGNFGGSYFVERYRENDFLKYFIRTGLYRQSPNFRSGMVYQREMKNFLNFDLLKMQLLYMSDGWFSQYFSPTFFERLRPNQDLPNYIHSQRRIGHLETLFDVVYYQKFSGSKVLQDEIAIPNLHVLPRLQINYRALPIEMTSVVERLSSEKDKDFYPGVKRALSYLGYAYNKGQNFECHLGAWLKSQRVDDFSDWNDYRKQHSFAVPNLELSYRLDLQEKTNFSIFYAYTGYVDQSRDPVFQRRWQWLSGQWDFDKVLSLDRVYDRSRMWLTFHRHGFDHLSSLFVEASHILDFSTPRVSLSKTGAEDPLIDYGNKVSLFKLGDSSRNLYSEGVWLWSLGRFYQYKLNWKYHRFSLEWLSEPDSVVFQNQLIRVPMYKRANVIFDAYKTQSRHFFLGVDYRRGLDKFLEYQGGIVVDQCCWKAKASVYLTNWMSSSDSLKSVFTGMQPSVKVGFSFKGLQSAGKKMR